MSVTFSPAALEDLMDIAFYIAKDNPARASTFVDEIEAKCQRLGKAPFIGTERKDIGPGMRMTTHKTYLIFYRDSLPPRIERVLHSARDIDHQEFDSVEPEPQ